MPTLHPQMENPEHACLTLMAEVAQRKADQSENGCVLGYWIAPSEFLGQGVTEPVFVLYSEVLELLLAISHAEPVKKL